VRHLKDDPADLDLAREITQKIRLIAPDAELPRLPGEERRPRPRGARSSTLSRLPVPERLRRRAPETPSQSGAGAGTETRGRLGTTLSKRQTQLAVGLGSAALLLVTVVLGVAGAFSSGDDEAPSTTTNGTTTAAANASQLGFPLFQRAPKDPAHARLPRVDIDDSGNFQDTFPVPRGYQQLLPRTQAIYVTLSKASGVLAAVSKALDNGKPSRVSGKTSFAGILNTANAQKNVIPIPLQADKGVRGSGAAALGLAKGSQLFFDLKLTDVDQPPQGSAYVVWFVLGTA
jgi:hypothetical protein